MRGEPPSEVIPTAAHRTKDSLDIAGYHGMEPVCRLLIRYKRLEPVSVQTIVPMPQIFLKSVCPQRARHTRFRN